MPIMANAAPTENEIVTRVVRTLADRLPRRWSLTTRPSRRGDVDALVRLRAPDGRVADIALEAKRDPTPRAIEDWLERLDLGRAAGRPEARLPVMMVAPYLSPAVRTKLTEADVSWVDLTGNARVAISDPAVFIETSGSDRNPYAPERRRARLRGPKAWRLLRVLAESSPPLGVRELAGTTGTVPGYVSRLLEALDDQTLVERDRRGRVSAVDWRGVLRLWADTYGLFEANAISGFVSPRGASAALNDVAGVAPRYAVTGSFAAARLAPVAAPALLVVYLDDPDGVGERLGMLGVDSGADVLLARPWDESVFDGTVPLDGVVCAPPAQVAVDCLTGNGRMPAEGEALLDWMAANPEAWRRVDAAA